MYNIKEVIEKMKHIANVNSNASLARLLNISYNTLNTWIKRNKLPQEVILAFCKEYDCSLDYLLLDSTKEFYNDFNNNKKEIEPNSSPTLQDKNINTFLYYGNLFEEEDKISKIKLTLKKDIICSNSKYLLKKDNIYIVAQCKFDIFNDTVAIDSFGFSSIISLEKFKKLNMGLIIEYKYI